MIHDNLEVINDFFDERVDIENESLDAFISTQVFEHLELLNQVMKVAYDKLKVGGIGFIEVPNGQKTINENRYFDVFPEHINYFTPLSLANLVYRSGFEIIKISEEFNSSFITAFIKKGGIYSGFNLNKKNDIDKIESLFKKYNNISVWGAGTKARSFITLMKGNSIKHIFDNNSLIQGGYLCNSQVAIEQPNKDTINENDLIIIFATSYKREIEKELREKYNFTGEIISMDCII